VPPVDVIAAVPSEDELTGAIEVAARAALTDLFAAHPENFYYVSLITTGEAHPPVLSAWSTEALEAAAITTGRLSADLKWSYADSPYFGFGEQHFNEVKSLFSRRPQMNFAVGRAIWETEYDARLRCIERSLRQLDSQGLFGVGERRLGVVINAEVMPPDASNTERAIRLNPRGSLAEWLEEAAE
jgi:hypothetical protein